MSRRERWAWLVPLTVMGLVSLTGDAVVEAWGTSRASGAFVLAGIAFGIAWYHVFPRPLVERLLGWSMLAVLAAILLLLGGGDGTLDLGVAVVPGLVAGLVLAEGWGDREGSWSHQRRTALSSRKQLNDLR